jgi:4-amino-4-deoxy-L-arabinose transferase-like glycosyltransferase
MIAGTAAMAGGNDNRVERALFLTIAVIVIMAGIGLRDPWPTDEPRFALVARQMVESGDWLIPHRGHELYADKPPAFMAMQAAAYELTGNWRIAFLLPSALAAFGMLLLVYDLARRLWDHRTGLYAAGALLATFQFVYQAKRAQIDPAVAFFITLAYYGLLRHFLLGPCWRWYWFGCFAAGLGVITKGVGVIALLMFVPYLFARVRRWHHLAPIGRAGWRWLAGAACFLAAVSLWLGPMLARVASVGTPEYREYVHDILFHQTAARYAASWDHPQPPWFYFGVMLTSWLPLALTYPATVPAWYRALASRDARFLLPIAWVAMVVVFFSIPGGKRDVYLMPALPCIALVSAPFLQVTLQRRWFRYVAFGLTAMIGVAFVVAGVFALVVHPQYAVELAAQHDLAARGDVLWCLLLAIGLAALVPACVLRIRHGAQALLASLFGMWMLWSFWACSLLNDSNSAAGVMRNTSETIGRQGQLGLVAWEEPLMFLADRKVSEFGLSSPWRDQLSAAIRWQEEAPQNRWILISGAAMSPCIDKTRAYSAGIANRREWWLFRNDAIEAECRDGHVPALADGPAEPPSAD